jgi:hypothetical protein
MRESIIDKDQRPVREPAIEANELSLPLPQLVVLERAETEVVAGGILVGPPPRPQPPRPVPCPYCGLMGGFPPLPGL